jgi:hypothetical protein
MQPAAGVQHWCTGSKIQVIRIPENNLRTEIKKLALLYRLHRALGPDRHEDWCFNQSMVRLKNPGPGVAILRNQRELQECLAKVEKGKQLSTKIRREIPHTADQDNPYVP